MHTNRLIRDAAAAIILAGALSAAAGPAFAQKTLRAETAATARGGIAYRPATQAAPAPQTAPDARSGSARVVQQGTGNAAGMLQQGEGNTGAILQYGNHHSATLQQYGANNSGCIVQLGKGQSLDMVQSGENLSTGVVQAGRGRVEALPEGMCNDPTKRRQHYHSAFMAARKIEMWAKEK